MSVTSLGAGATAVASSDDLAAVDAWWRAIEYLGVVQTHLAANPLLRRALEPGHLRPHPSGQPGTSAVPGFVHAHASALVRRTGQRMIYLADPRAAGAALIAASWLEGRYSEVHPEVSRDEAGLERLCRDSTRGRVSPATPGTVHGDGELGDVLAHAFGAVLDAPDLVALTVIGEDEAETAALEASWKDVRFLDPRRDGAVLPVLHLGGAGAGDRSRPARRSLGEVRALLEGHGYEVLDVEGGDPPGVHERFAAVLARALAHVHAVQQRARRHGDREPERPHWPVIVLRPPPGWTGPRVLRTGARTDPGRCARLEARLRSHRPEGLFDATGAPSPQVMAACPAGDLRLGATAPVGRGGPTSDLQLPPLEAHAVELPAPGRIRLAATHRLGPYLRDVDAAHRGHFRLTVTDATLGDQLGAVAEVRSDDTGRRWLEGYTRTGRHGLHAASEAFTTVGASQAIQHATWLEQAAELPWRAPVPSLNVLVTSSLREPDGAHRGAGLVQQALGRRGARVYLPPDANCLLAVTDRCLRCRSRVNLVLVDEQPGLQWLEMPDAVAHCAAGAGVWDWAGTDDDRDDPDIVLACAGDVVTTETVAAADILRRFLPHLRVRVVNVVDLWSLAPPEEPPHGADIRRFAELFTDTVDVVFAVHGFPAAVHQVLHGRPDAARFRVRGAVARAGSRTPFDVLVQNRVSRYHLVLDALAGARRVPRGAGALAEWCGRRLAEHERHVVEHLEDVSEVQDWALLLPPPHAAIEEDLRLRRIAEE